ncbi:Major capsid protein [Phytophthora nicotianae]|uniref:Major capsid protein n=1 Tax=Phytophthora nicotianae TaxID=4792 RepID=A0A0W8DYX8_PHYNI|nr:Major capsid protein [Phytophthora nicotianae]
MDQLLLANQLLRDNIAAVKARKAAGGEADPNPTLADLERSHVLFVNAHHKPYVAIAFQYFKVSANNVTLGSDVSISIPQYGDFFADMVANVVIRAPTTSYSGGFGDDSDCVIYRHCDYPGERIFDEVRFEVNSNPIDSYTSETYVLHRQFNVPQDKLAAWKRCMGQETPMQARDFLQETGGTKAPVTKHTKTEIYNGYPTFKETHNDLNLWIPLLFWFNTDIRLAFPSVSVPYGQRFITFSLTQASNLYHAILNPARTTTTITSPRLSTPQISTFDLYINNLFVLPEVHDIFIDRVAFALVRVHRRQTQNLNKSSESIHFVQLKWPIESLTFGFQPTVNRAKNTNLEANSDQSSSVSSDMEDWHRFGVVSNTQMLAADFLGSMGALGLLVKEESSHITTLQLQAHSVNLFSTFPAAFFNSYIPYQFGGSALTAPTDPGLYYYSFALYPNQYQPSGHFNVSRARELYLNYTSSFISSDANHTATFFVQAKTINFLLISEGSASLRYST